MEREEEKQPDFKIYLTRRTFDPDTEPDIPPSERPEHYIVQFKRSLTGEERKYLRAKYKLALDKYIPNFAFLERLDFNTLTALSEDSLHRASALFQPKDKISPEIGHHSPSREEQSNPYGLLIRVLLFPNVNEEDISNVVRAIEDLLRKPIKVNRIQVETQERSNGNGKHEEQRDFQLESDEIRILDDRKLGGEVQLVLVLPSLDLLPLIAKLYQVQWIEEVVESNSDDSPTTTTTLLDTNTIAGTIQAGDPTQTPLWDNGINGTGQRIGIIDHTRVDVTHCMFRDEPNTPYGVGHRKVIGFRPFYAGGGSDHGTAVAAIAAGDELHNSGLHPHRGIAWYARISYDDQRCIGRNRTLLQLLRNQFNDDDLTHSNSWHDQTTEYNNNARDVDCFVWANEEHFVCASAGNSAASELLGPPGTAKNALCVSASLPHPNHLEHGDGLQGPTRDTRRKPEICAPGAGITTADAGSGCGWWAITDAATSYATPVIAGAAALVRQYYLEGFYPAGSRDYSRAFAPSGALIKASLLNSTVPMEDVANYPNERTGWGLVQLNNTLFLEDSPRQLFIADVRNSNGLLTGESQAYEINVDSYAQPLKITLAWTDPPANLYATGKALVNNLDLVVTSPNGESYLGNINFSQGFSEPVAPDTIGDDCNNVEMVIIETPAQGVWTITVRATAVNRKRQGYAIVVTGSLHLY